MQCCKEADFCNKQLYPMYETGDDYEDYDSGGSGGLNPAIFHLVLLCTVTVCVVSLGMTSK